MSNSSEQLALLEKERKKILLRSKLPKILAVLLLLAAIVLFIVEIILWAVIAAGVAILLIMQAELPKKRFQKNFKQKVVGSLAQQIDGSMTYDPSGGWGIDLLYSLGLVPAEPTSGKSEDFFKGTIGDTEIAFCEMSVEHTESDINQSGKRRSSTTKLFSGLVFKAKFNRTLKGETLIIPKVNSQKLASILLEKYKNNQLLDKAFANSPLESVFDVFASNEANASELLTDSFTSLLGKLYDKLQASAPCQISLIFQEQKMYIAIDWQNNFFEYSINKTVEEEIKETLEELHLCTGIVNDLNLNERLWTTQ